MVNFRKTVILKDISEKGAAGILKITNGEVPLLSLTLNKPIGEGKTLLVKTDRLLTFPVTAKNMEVVLPRESASDESVSCLIVDNANKALLYGTNATDTVRCFGLLEEYSALTKAESARKTPLNKSAAEQAAPSEGPANGKTAVAQKEKQAANNMQKNLSDAKRAFEKAFSEVKEAAQNPAVEKPAPDKVKAADATPRPTDSAPVKQQSRQQSGEQIKKNNRTGTVASASADKALNDRDSARMAATVLSKGVKYDGNNFYLAVQPQLDEMFICYPEEHALEAIVPNSKWIRVNTENDFYVVGIIYELDEPRFICYGLSGSYNVPPPAEVAGICDWLPLSLDDRYGDGYWLIYQDCRTGDTVRRPPPEQS